ALPQITGGTLVEEVCDLGISPDTPDCEYVDVAPGASLTTKFVVRVTDSRHGDHAGRGRLRERLPGRQPVQPVPDGLGPGRVTPLRAVSRCGGSADRAPAAAASPGYVRRARHRIAALPASGTSITRNVHLRPLLPPPKTWSEMAPKSSGARACASDLTTVRTASARPQSRAGMTSSRAASSGGFCAASMKAAATR